MKKYVDTFNSFINESKKEFDARQEAADILSDILEEREEWEVHGKMTKADALATVKTYGHRGDKAKAIAAELWSMCEGL